jgi:hypothetical protein
MSIIIKSTWKQDAPCYKDEDDDHNEEEADDYVTSTSSVNLSYKEFLKFAIHDTASMHKGTNGTNIRRVASAPALQDAAILNDNNNHDEEEADDYVASTSSMILSYKECLKFAIHDIASMHKGTNGTNLWRVVSAPALQDATFLDDDNDHEAKEADDYVACISSIEQYLLCRFARVPYTPLLFWQRRSPMPPPPSLTTHPAEGLPPSPTKIGRRTLVWQYSQLKTSLSKSQHKKSLLNVRSSVVRFLHSS